MAKRGAEEQITKDNINLSNESADDSNGPSLATADVMAKRKILKPRGKGQTGSKSGFTLPSTTGSHPSTNHSDNGSKLKALNLQFLKAVNDKGNLAGVVDFRPIVQKYLDFYKSIESDKSSQLHKLDDTPNFGNLSGAASDRQTPVELIETEKANPFANIKFGQASQSSKVDNPVPTSKKVEVKSDDESSEDEEKPIKIDGPKFTISSVPTIKKSPFSFGPKPIKKVSDDSSDSEVEIKGPSFTFNKTIQDPIFKFGKSGNLAGDNKLGSTSIANKDSPPKVKVGEEKAPATNAFAFGTSNISFGNGSANVNPGENKANLFGNTSNDAGQKPSFLFGITSGSGLPSTGFLFGTTSSSSEKPVSFQFGAVKDQASGTKPLFQFGALKDSETPNASGAKPATSTFAFGSLSSNTFAGQKSATLSSSETGIQNNGAESTPKENGLMPEEETGADFAPVATLGTKKIELEKNEEDDETVLFQRKSKLMILDTKNKENPYKNMGIGELKVLKNETGKSRILMRADGGLRILLNVALLKGITYTTMGNGSHVKVPAANQDGSIETYVLKVKTATDGKELCDTLNEANK